MENLEKQYPDKIFIWWTIPLTQTGQYCTDTLNSIIRNYARNNEKILFDIADIEAYDTDGNHILNPDGLEMAFSGYCGEKPPGPSCHPNWTGKLLLGKAFWWMLSEIALRYQISGLSDNQPEISFSLNPNPVNDVFFIRYSNNYPCRIRIIIQDIFSRNIIKVAEGFIDTGNHEFKVSLNNLSIGTYFIRIETGMNNSTKLFHVIK